MFLQLCESAIGPVTISGFFDNKAVITCRHIRRPFADRVNDPGSFGKYGAGPRALGSGVTLGAVCAFSTGRRWRSVGVSFENIVSSPNDENDAADDRREDQKLCHGMRRSGFIFKTERFLFMLSATVQGARLKFVKQGFTRREVVDAVPAFGKRANPLNVEWLTNIQEYFSIRKEGVEVGLGQGPDLSCFCTDKVDKRIVCGGDGFLDVSDLLEEVLKVFFMRLRDSRRSIELKTANTR